MYTCSSHSVHFGVSLQSHEFVLIFYLFLYFFFLSHPFLSFFSELHFTPPFLAPIFLFRPPLFPLKLLLFFPLSRHFFRFFQPRSQVCFVFFLHSEPHPETLVFLFIVSFVFSSIFVFYFFSRFLLHFHSFLIFFSLFSENSSLTLCSSSPLPPLPSTPTPLPIFQYPSLFLFLQTSFIHSYHSRKHWKCEKKPFSYGRIAWDRKNSRKLYHHKKQWKKITLPFLALSLFFLSFSSFAQPFLLKLFFLWRVKNLLK